MNTIRVRFAPSPTGFLHIGGARTALFSWLFACHHKGVFVLRIEDTDEKRSTLPAVKAILEGMSWLGLDWDEGPKIVEGDSEYKTESQGDYGPYFQTQRLDIYRKYAEQLINQKKAYRCYCLPEELEQKRKEASKKGLPPKYDRQCKHLTSREEEKKKQEGRKAVIRFCMPDEGQTEINDLVKGKVVFENSLLDDFVILKSSGVATYNFAVVVDDAMMKISHIIRGDDHISNTPRQILLYQALEWELPQFAHVPMILGADKTRLSKRHGATALGEYKEKGFLPEAMINYLALLGWSTEDSRQIFSREELINKFSLAGCGRSSAIFDQDKLLWMNGEYIRKMGVDKLTEKSFKWLKEADLVNGASTWDKVSEERKERIKKAVGLEHEKIKLLSEVPSLVDYMLEEGIEYDSRAVEKALKKENVIEILEGIKDFLKELEDFSVGGLEEGVRAFCLKKELKTSKVFHPLRVATSGRMQGPGLFVLLEFLGKEKVIKRIEKSILLLGGSI